LIVEGKTDKWILDCAWSKLNTDRDCPFDIIPSGIYLNENESEGNAEQVRRAIEFLSSISNEKIIIGIFDNDREGNEQFKGLNKKIFEEYKISNLKRKHKKANVFGILLPIPKLRELFVDNRNLLYRFFVIEHYFSDNILKSHSLIGDKILNTEVFEIKYKSKTNFAEKIVQTLNTNEFNNFKMLFDQIELVINSCNPL